MRNLKNKIAGAAGLVILAGALVATPNTAYAQSSKTQNGAVAESESSLLTPHSATRLELVSIDQVDVSPAGAPDLGACPNLEVPEGHRAFYSVFAEGVQIYRWNGTSWTFVAPDAVLFSNINSDGAVGIHYAGPTWESVSGSKVVGRVVERCTPDATAIPWLLLEAVHTQGPGIFGRVTYIHRTNTVGGLAPAQPGTVVGQVARVPYTTDYVFYRAHN
jgi:hypothetical protein